MIYLPTLLGVAALIGLAVFFWRRDGPGSGLWFGHRIAAHIGLPKSVFMALLESGARDSAREVLARLQAAGLGLDAAATEVAPVLQRGIEKLEGRFGRQEIYEQAKPVVARLLAAQPPTDEA